MASSPSKTALIFGTGANIGSALVKGFLGAGYRVAIVSRSKRETTDPDDDLTLLSIQADLSNPSAVMGVYQSVRDAGWEFPSVVIWNAASYTLPASSDPENPLEIPEQGLDDDLALMIKSPYIAAREATREWKKKKTTEDTAAGRRRGTFIMTGNLLPRKILPVPALVDLGIGKAGANYWVGSADALLKKEGIRFFFADERTPAGEPVGSKPDGEGHAAIYLGLVDDDEVAYYVTFSEGKYKEFST